MPYAEKDGYAFQRCDACGYVFCHPRPTNDHLAEIYGHDSKIDDALQYGKASSRRRRAIGNVFKLWRYVWRRRVLDIGCGGGFVVEAMRNMGAREVVGLDIGNEAIAFAKRTFPKCTFYRGAFHDLRSIVRDFDFIFSSEVIEHVSDIDEYVSFVRDALKPGGVIYITTPDIGSHRIPDNVTDWNMFSPPLHIQFFNENSLTSLMTRYGFTPIRRISDRQGTGLKMLFKKNE